jgi:hypothetical protein
MQEAEELGGVRDLAEYKSLMDDIIKECQERKEAAEVAEIVAEEGSTDTWDWKSAGPMGKGTH